MMRPMRWLLGLVVIAVLVFCGLYVAAGRSAPPHITITRPDRAVGQVSTLDVTTEAPVSRLTALTISLEQAGKTTPLFTLRGGQGATTVDATHLRVTQPFGKENVPALQSGPA